MGTYAPKVGYATSTTASHENLMAYQEVVKSNGLSVAMLGFCSIGALSMFPKIVHNPEYMNKAQGTDYNREQVIDILSKLGLYVISAKGTTPNIPTLLQQIKINMGFETSRIGIGGVHVPKTQAEERLVLYALKKNPSIEQLAQYILRVPFSDLK